MRSYLLFFLVAQFMVTLWSSVFIVQEVLIPQSLRYSEVSLLCYTMVVFLSSHDLVKSFMLCVLATFIVTLIGHTCILHAWMNMWAEITQFADREFFSVSTGDTISKSDPLHLGLVDLYVLFFIFSQMESTCS